jgi:alkanesulfonate monooxygenase SsuD/methylene tetrahydromethanopterin reductase-like flavin-dependent oxidoreductase (luciferase family)
MSVAIGYMPGAFGQGGQDPNFLRQLVQVGDTYGYDSLWLSDRIVGQQFSLEPIVALSMVAAYSDRLKFGTSVLALPIRNPVVLAKQIATLDYLSRGRCFPAVGLGQDDPTEYEACGGHCQLIEKIPNKWVKHLTTDLLTPCILVHECQGKSQEIGYLSLS